MKKPLILFAVALAACSQQAENAQNSGLDTNIAAEPTGSAVPGEDGQQPADPPVGDVTTPPQQNETDPPAEPTGDVSLSVTPARTSAGSTVTLTLGNESRQAIGYNLCTSALQTASGSAVRTDRVCTMELRTLQPGRSASYSYELPGSLADGRYRFSTGLERMPDGGRLTVTSNSFEVR